jgi:hypothetical protein
MADRYPLIVDSSNQNIKELPDGDSLLLGDSEKLRLGDGQDLNLYHDGTNSYLENSTGILKIATETSGIAVTIGHTTSETTVADNLTITGVATASTSANITQAPLATSGATISWNAATHANAYLVPSTNLTIDLPTNPVEGAIISVEIAQGGTPYTVAWNTVFEFAASTAPVVTATANKTDIFAFRYNGSVWQEIGRVQNMAQT